MSAPRPSGAGMRSPIAQTGQSEAIHSPDACARTVLSRTIPIVSSTEVVCTVAISCWLRVLRTISRPLDNGAYRKVCSVPRGPSDLMAATNDFSGLTSWAWALASAAAMEPMLSLERCMAALHPLEIKADGTRFGTPGANAVANRFLGILRH